jgi:hypothetical protein
MATIDTTRRLIYDTFITAWGAETPYTFDNEEFDQPTDTSWLRLVVRNSVTKQSTLGSIGSRKFLRNGVVFVQLFTPLHTGVAETDRLVLLLQAIFEGFRFTDVWFEYTDVRELGIEGKWFQTSLETTFNYEQTK